MINLEETFTESPFLLVEGDCLETLKTIPDNSIDSIVSDPPYGLSDHKPQDVVDCLTAWLSGKEYKPNKKGFMGRTWDSWVPGPEVWKEVYRVLKPGGHIAAFAGSRTHDLMSMALRLAGFENRDTIMWVYGSGFPKSMDVSKAIDKSAGAEREVVGVVDPRGSFDGIPRKSNAINTKWRESEGRIDIKDLSRKEITAPSTDDAKKFEGWGTALKPAFEPIILFRKPLEGTVAQNVIEWGTGGINIDACRVETAPDDDIFAKNPHTKGGFGHAGARIYGDGKGSEYKPQDGRFPANFVHDGSDEVEENFPDSNGAGKSLPQVKVTGYGNKNTGTGKADYLGGERIPFEGGSGSASRFFYCAKASRADRDSGLDDAPDKILAMSNQAKAELARGNMNKDSSGVNTAKVVKNNHPTVKPIALMDWLVKLITPHNGIILDPFNGSGSTGKAAMINDFKYIGLDLSKEYIEISRGRIEYAIKNKDSIKKELTKKSKDVKVDPVVSSTTEENSLANLFQD